ncbi:hypothetical protein [Stutzerimonas stutzeri]|uniref:hypothetical protein n=1 Tax=Stutzerimonas stutzeri TaxID=316 RepID=UPI001179F5A7|nr:hypothetical protein [Stutzerimonas stutzeri]UNL98659.1 hypothetical protein IGX38_20755 [Stutzerimonas stutzeri]
MVEFPLGEKKRRHTARLEPESVDTVVLKSQLWKPSDPALSWSLRKLCQYAMAAPVAAAGMLERQARGQVNQALGSRRRGATPARWRGKSPPSTS